MNPVNVIPMEEPEPRPLSVDPELCLKLIQKIPYEDGDVLYDPFRENSDFFDMFPDELHKDSRSSDMFFRYPKTVDWVIGHPPFHIEELSREDHRYSFFDLCEFFANANRCKKGFCFLVNNSSYLAITPNRLEALKDLGFLLKKQVMVNLKNNKGRSFFMMFMKDTIIPDHPAIDYILGTF